MWMNAVEIEWAARQRHDCPNVRKGVRLLNKLVEAANDQSAPSLLGTKGIMPMNDPLCLPRTSEAWERLCQDVAAFATKVCGTCVNLRFQACEHDDAKAMFTFTYFIDPRTDDERNGDGVGLLTAQWDKNGKVYVAMAIEGFGTEGRWFDAPDPQGAFWIDGKPGEGRQHVGWLMREWQASKK
jgi:hypothetical protein